MNRTTRRAAGNLPENVNPMYAPSSTTMTAMTWRHSVTRVHAFTPGYVAMDEKPFGIVNARPTRRGAPPH